MIAALFWLAQMTAALIAAAGALPVAASPSPTPASAAPAVAAPSGGSAPFPQLAPAAVLVHYAAALKKLKEPHVISFDYTLEQTGLRVVSQTHRVFRSGNDERDETLAVDGKRLSPPKVRIFRGRRNRYTVGTLAPREADYRFSYMGTFKDGHHFDYVFRLTPKAVRPFTVTDLTIDGVRFLPIAVGFTTSLHAGAGTIVFGSNARWWVPYVATARATVAADVAAEKLTFFTYRFPPTLPSSTFTQARRAPRTPAARHPPLPGVPPTPLPGVPPTPLPVAPAKSRPVAPAAPLPVVPAPDFKV